MQRLVLATLFLFFIALGALWRSNDPKNSVENTTSKSIILENKTLEAPLSNIYKSQSPEIHAVTAIESLRNDPNDFAALESILEGFDLEKNSEKRIQTETDLRQLSDKCKNCSSLKLLAGETALKNSHFESARIIFKEILTDDSSNQAAKRKMIEVSRKLNDFVEASAVLGSLIEDRSAEIARLASLGESTAMHEKFLVEDQKEYLQLQEQLN